MLKYLIPAAIGFALCFLLMRSCTGTTTVTVYDTHKSDSVIAKAKRDSIDYTTHIAVLENLVDEKTDLTDSIYLSLSDKLERNQFTLAKLRTAKSGHDTVTFVQSCDTLVNEYNALVDEGLKYKFERDTLITTLRKVKETDSLHNIEQDATRLSLIGSLSESTEIAKKWQKQAGKRWSVGLNAGYGVGKGGLTPIAGVGVQYRLIRF